MNVAAHTILKSQAPRGMRNATTKDIQLLLSFLTQAPTTTIISGAGISTESGLKDYRSPGRQTYRKQIKHDDFIKDSNVRTRYWARSFLGYQIFNHAKPNDAHKALTNLHSVSNTLLPYHITQNVDGLLQQAGLANDKIVELHGTIHQVRCLVCDFRISRDRFQQRCEMMNKKWVEEFKRVLPSKTVYLPDGDAEIEAMFAKRFQTPMCEKCGNDVIPDIVFFGGSVPRDVTEKARDIIEKTDNVLAVGSSLATMSSYDLVRRAKAKGGGVAIVNYGPTRADDISDLKFEVAVSDALKKLNLEFRKKINNTARPAL